ncbi:MAG: diphosphomevalonate decarboxylase [Pseudomonadota bacterium]
MSEARAVFDRLLPARLRVARAASAYAPANIALSKYWGKRDTALNLPQNSSLSISLGKWGTTTRVAPAAADRLVFNEEELPADAPAARKLWDFIALWRRDQTLPLDIVTANTIPTAAGLASSASGFAALTRALDEAFDLSLDAALLSQIARFGSGSASRSLWHGFVRWNRGDAADGSDSFAVPLELRWPAFRIAIVPVDTGPKAQSSRDGMGHTLRTSPLYATWPVQAEADCAAMAAAIMAQDFAALGPLAEANALAMHATMMAARPALTYLKPASWAVLERVWGARADGAAIYATMDAGANVKLIFLADALDAVASAFPEAEVIAPFRD